MFHLTPFFLTPFFFKWSYEKLGDFFEVNRAHDSLKVIVRDLEAGTWSGGLLIKSNGGDVGIEVRADVAVSPPGLGTATEEGFTNSVGMEFVLIPAGSFMMGSPPDEPEREDDETQHKVTITKPFYLQTTQVTQGQWRDIMGSNPPSFKNCGDDCPVETVSWDDCQKFIQRLNHQKGVNNYRLPTEAEWEYACRAGTETPFSFGKCLSTDEANYDGNYPMPSCTKGEYREGRPVPVGSFSPNAWGLYDMHGNVWEWCQDWYGDYPSGHVTDPIGPSSGSNRVNRGGSWRFYLSALGFSSTPGSNRVDRGGSWRSDARYCRSAIRDDSSPGFRRDYLGFRLANTQNKKGGIRPV